MNERPGTPQRGIFDNPPSPAARQRPAEESAPRQKENFPDVHAMQAQMVQKTEAAIKQANKTPDIESDQVNKINDAMGSSSVTTIEEEDLIPEEDIKLAEQLVFRGYAEKNIEMTQFPGKKFTICSTNADEIGIIDDVIFDMIKNLKSNSDGTLDMPENTVRTMRNALYIAISYRGVDGKELSPEPVCALNTIKKAIYVVIDYLNDGKIKEAAELKESVKKSLSKRASLVRRLPTPMIDFLSGEKFKFDNRMSEIMNRPNIISKS